MYLMLLMQFLENKVAVELTRSEFVEAQEVSHLLPALTYLLCIFYFGVTGIVTSIISIVTSIISIIIIYIFINLLWSTCNCCYYY